MIQRREADAFFPAVDTTIWHEKSREVHPADEKHLCSYAFCRLRTGNRLILVRIYHNRHLPLDGFME